MFIELLFNANVVVGKKVRLAHRIAETRHRTEGNGGHGGILMAEGRGLTLAAAGERILRRIIGRFVAPNGLYDSAQGLLLYLFSVDSYGPKGQENLAQGLPWVLGLSREALKGRTLTSRPRTTSRNPGAPSGLDVLEHVSQGKPWARLSWPFGPRSESIRVQYLGNTRDFYR
jgi:hypothetical protein